MNEKEVLGYSTLNINITNSIIQRVKDMIGLDFLFYELLQNADDSNLQGKRATHFVCRVYNDKIVINIDSVFTRCDKILEECTWDNQNNKNIKTKKCDFHAILEISSGNKDLITSNSNTKIEDIPIGKFGVGFLSVYQITSVPQIESNEIGRAHV